MFNPNVSAYGRGIASNLVSEEQRQRFNYGGRVRAWNGLDIEPEPYSYDIQDTIPKISDKKWWKLPKEYRDPNIDPRFQEDITDIFPRITRRKEEEKEEKARIEGTIEKDIATEGKSFQDIFYDKELEKARLGKSDKYKTGEGGIGLIEKETEPVDLDEVDNLRNMPDSDELWSPQEKKEKRDQLMVALGKTLVKHAPVKFGTQKSSDIIAEGIGEAGKITDPTAIRDMQKKYKEWGKARTKETLAGLREQERINSSEEALLNQHIGQPLSFKVSEILKIKNVERNTPFIVKKVPDPNNPGKEKKGRVIDKTKLEVGILYTDPADPNSFMVLDSQGIIQTLSSTTDIIEARDKKLIK